MNGQYWRAYVEDVLSKEVLLKMINEVNHSSRHKLTLLDGFPAIQRGFGKIKRNSQKFLAAAKNGVGTIIVTDLDCKACAPTLIRNWFQLKKDEKIQFPHIFVFRIAVREIESWVMADRSPFAKFLGIPVGNFDSFPDHLEDPRQFLLQVIQKKGKKIKHKEMLPVGVGSIGPRYNEIMCEFVKKHWVPSRASANSNSLQRALNALQKITIPILQ